MAQVKEKGFILQTITRQQLKKYLLALDDKAEYLSNWGDKNYEGLDNVLSEAIRGEYEHSDNDVDLISGIANASGNIETSLSVLHETLGYDSIVVDEPEWGQEQKIYIALTNDVINIVSIKDLERGKLVETKSEKVEYVSQLDSKTQKRIEKELKTAIEEMGLYNKEEVKEHVQRGMDSKIHDLTDTIDIEKIIENAKKEKEKVRKHSFDMER